MFAALLIIPIRNGPWNGLCNNIFTFSFPRREDKPN